MHTSWLKNTIHIICISFKYQIISYHIVSYRIVSYHIIPVSYQYHTSIISVSYQYHTSSISYHIISYHIISYHIIPVSLVSHIHAYIICIYYMECKLTISVGDLYCEQFSKHIQSSAFFFGGWTYCEKCF